MKKVLAAIRRNGVEVATVFDQVYTYDGHTFKFKANICPESH